MSVSISGASPLSSSPITGATAPKGGKAQGAQQDQSSEQITNQVTTTSADGSSTTVITYADGTTSTTTTQGTPATQAAKNGQQAQPGQPGASGPSTTGGLLDPANLGQNAALLSAQEQARG